MTLEEKEALISQLELIHTDLMKEEGITVKELPENIQKKIRGFDLLHSKLQTNPTNTILTTCNVMSIEIAELIQDWVERDLDEEEETRDETSEESPAEEAS